VVGGVFASAIAAAPSELARRLGVPATTLSATIALLVARGELRRARHPSDGRSYVLELTARGRKTQASAGQASAQAQGRVRQASAPGQKKSRQPSKSSKEH
jgi:DNA-binding MarR family transcriptional regulator